MKRRVFPPLLCAIVSCVIPWRRFVSPFRFAVSFRRAVYRFEPKSKRGTAVVVQRGDPHGA